MAIIVSTPVDITGLILPVCLPQTPSGEDFYTQRAVHLLGKYVCLQNITLHCIVCCNGKNLNMPYKNQYLKSMPI